MFFFEVKKCEPFGEQIETLKTKLRFVYVGCFFPWSVKNTLRNTEGTEREDRVMFFEMTKEGTENWYGFQLSVYQVKKRNF